MTRQYKRYCEIIIQNETTRLRIAGLRTAFTVEKDLRGYPNLLSLTLFNLSRESRSKIQNEFDQVIVNVGYENNVRTAFVGEVKNVTHTVAGVDAMTNIFAADGHRDFTESYSNFTLAEGATLKDIVSRVVKDFKGVVIGLIEGVDTSVDKLQGYTVSKPTRKILDELAAEHDFDWVIEQGNLKLIDRNSIENVEFKISADTGMVGSPSITEIGADVTFLLNPEVLPGRVIQIESAGADVAISNLQFRPRETVRTEAAGRYKVLKVTHTGDTHGDAWHTRAVGEVLR